VKHNPKLTWAQGDQHLLRVRVRDLSFDRRGKENADLTGYTAKFALSLYGKKGYFKTPVLVVDAVILDQSTNKGYLTVLVESADTAPLSGLYHWQVEIDDGLGGTEVVADGDLEFVVNIDEP